MFLPKFSIYRMSQKYDSEENFRNHLCPNLWISACIKQDKTASLSVLFWLSASINVVTWLSLTEGYDGNVLVDVVLFGSAGANLQVSSWRRTLNFHLWNVVQTVCLYSHCVPDVVESNGECWNCDPTFEVVFSGLLCFSQLSEVIKNWAWNATLFQYASVPACLCSSPPLFQCTSVPVCLCSIVSLVQWASVPACISAQLDFWFFSYKILTWSVISVVDQTSIKSHSKLPRIYAWFNLITALYYREATRL